MRVGVTELRNTRNAVRKRHLANATQTTSGGRGRRHLANAYETPSGRWVITARVMRRGAEQRFGASRTLSRGRVITASSNNKIIHKITIKLKKISQHIVLKTRSQLLINTKKKKPVQLEIEYRQHNRVKKHPSIHPCYAKWCLACVTYTLD